MGFLAHRIDHRLLETGLRIGRVADRVEAIGNVPEVFLDAVAGGAVRAEHRVVRVRGLMQVHVHEEGRIQLGHHAHEIGRFLGRTVREKRAVRVERERVPPVDGLETPGAHAGHAGDVHPVRIVRRHRFQEAQGAQHAAGFVAVHTTGDQDRGSLAGPRPALEQKQRIARRVVGQGARAREVESLAEGFDACDDEVRIGTSYLLTVPPGGLLRIARRALGGGF